MVTLRSMAFLMAPMMLIVSSPRPPSVSATMGMKFTPMERQAYMGGELAPNSNF